MNFDTALGLAVTALRAAGRSERTVENYRGILRKLDASVGLLGDKPDVAARLVAWRAGQVQLCVAGQRSRSAFLQELAAIRNLYRTLHEEKAYDVDLGRTIRGLGRDPWFPRPMPVPDLQRLLGSIPLQHPGGTWDAAGIQDAALVELYTNGLRNVEVCRLMTGDLSVDEREKVVVVRVHGKGDKPGEVLLRDESAEALFRHLAFRFAPESLADSQPMPDRLDTLLKTMAADGSWPVFLRENGKRLTRQWSNRRFRRCRERAGLDAKYGPHSLRHTYATELLETGSDIRVVQECLRHTSIRTTERYTLVRKGPKALAVRRLHFGVTGPVHERKEGTYAAAGVEEAAESA